MQCRRRPRPPVRVELDEERNDLDANIEWEEDFTAEDGTGRVMIGWFTLYRWQMHCKYI